MAELPKKLEDRYRIFAAEYIKDLNAARSARAAGYSEKGDDVTGHRLLRNAKVQKLIQAAMDKRATKCQVTADEVLEELKKMAFIDVPSFYKEGPNGEEFLIRFSEMTPAQRASVLEIREDIERIPNQDAELVHRKFKLHDKLKALELIGRHLKLFTDRTEHSGGIDLTTKKVVYVAKWGGSFEEDSKAKKDSD